MTIEQYIDSINKRYKLGNSTEHTFRGDLQQLLESLVPEIRATNEPKRQSCGAPDYILTKNDIPIGFIEAKDIGDKDLDGILKSGNKEQFDRYKASLSNLIFTDYLNFHLYVDGLLISKIAIADIQNGNIIPIPSNFQSFTNFIKDFCVYVSQNIKSSKQLAEMMASKARLLSDIIKQSVTSDESLDEDSTLKQQMYAFKEILIHDIKPKEFADVYAQTIAYGLFAARLHDPTLPTFSRQEAAELIPKSNPFLRKLFGYIAGPEIDDRIKWIVDSLVEIYLHCNVEELLKNYGKTTRTEDPIIHFYETFLSEYDPKLRKARGVWYTPNPIVNFIVRAVDDILKSEFDLSEGLSDTSKTKIKVNLQESDKRYKDNIKQVEEEIHRVQILDPATGTGTFLAEVIKQVHLKFKGQQGIWSNYVEKQLLPRLNGFELLMASYAMAHLQMDLLLTETGYKPSKDQRFRIYLTNSLEEHHKDTGTLFANWLSEEANEANRIKRDTPVMCILGNPPYSGESSNKGEWIMNLMSDYKKEPGGIEKLKEQNSKFINDDYVKFLRYGQHFIEKNGSGILAFINPHGFLDNPTFRGMRWNLLNTYDKIFTIDLHGNAKRKEISENGSVDENVFDIMQGVSINILIKTGKKKKNELSKVFNYDLFGKRDFKYNFLSDNKLSTINFEEIKCNAPMYFFVKKDFNQHKEYGSGFSVKELFNTNTIGVLSKNDKLAIQFSSQNLEKILDDFYNLNEAELKLKYSIKEDSRDWKINLAKSDVINNRKETKISLINYRPFDKRYTFISGKSRGFVAYSQESVRTPMKYDNIGLICVRQLASLPFNHVFVTNIISEQCFISSRTKEGGVLMPLYIYNNNGQQSLDGIRIPNLSHTLVNKIANKLDLKFTNEKNSNMDSFAPIDILDYIYAVLHSPTYREKYKEFLKIDFPRVPYPKDAQTFWELAKLGSEIREIHLLENKKVSNYITQYPIDGNNIVTKLKYQDGKVFINETQYFDNVPQIAWDFYIGGYQPAQKWLKDRKDRVLEFDDILHYQKIIVALTETDRLMKEIDRIEIE